MLAPADSGCDATSEKLFVIGTLSSTSEPKCPDIREAGWKACRSLAMSPLLPSMYNWTTARTSSRSWMVVDMSERMSRLGSGVDRPRDLAASPPSF